MAIRHWHPLKLVIVWAIGVALACLLWTIIVNLRASSFVLGVLLIGIFLVAIATPIAITWKWVSGREPYKLSRNDAASPLKADTRDLSANNAVTDKQYRICKIKLPKSLFNKGFEVPPNISERYTLPEETPNGEIIQEMEWEIDGWNLLSLFPIEKESDEEHVTVLALMERPFSAEVEAFFSRKYRL